MEQIWANLDRWGSNPDTSLMSIEGEKVFAKSECQHCENPIEFQADYDGLEVICPHCHNSTLLQYKKPIPPPLPLPAIKVPKVPIPKQSKSVAEVVGILCMWGFAIWTVIIGWILVSWFYGLSRSPDINEAFNGNNKYAEAGGTIGIALGIGMLFLVWLGVTVPIFMIFIFARLSIKKGKTTNENIK